MKPEISYDDFAKLDLRVATVLSAREHPNADKLLLLQIRVGDEEKQIVAGIRGHYQVEELAGRQIIVVNSLQGVVLRGEESNGMLLAASDGDEVVLLLPRPAWRWKPPTRRKARLGISPQISSVSRENAEMPALPLGKRRLALVRSPLGRGETAPAAICPCTAHGRAADATQKATNGS